MESAIWGLIGTVVGALTSIGTTWLSSQSSYNLQNARASDERIERASAFQRDTLLDLQEAIHDALRLSARAHLEDLEAHKTAGVWGGRPLTEEVNEGIRLANRRALNRGQTTVFLRPIGPARKTVQVGDFQCWTTI